TSLNTLSLHDALPILTDLRRQIERCRRGSRWLRPTLGRLDAMALAEQTFGQIVRFLEAGNYLIFHDAYPQLEAYAAARRAYLARSEEHTSELQSRENL